MQLITTTAILMALLNEYSSAFAPNNLHTKIATSITRRYGSIYAPDADEENKNNDGGEEELERDFMGMLKSKSGGEEQQQQPRVWDNATQKWIGGPTYNTPVATSSPDTTAAAAAEEEKVEESPTQEISQEQTTSTSPSTPYDGKIPVRFVNYETSNGLGPERLAYAKPGTNILKIADEAGVRIPRQCRSGLCGSCTADVKDPTWVEESGDGRVGYQTVRTCQAGAMLPSGCEEMIIDCYRTALDGGISGNPDGDDTLSLMEGRNPLSNFEDGWEDDFSPDYKNKAGGSGQVEVLKKSMPEYTVKEGERSAIEIEAPSWTPRIDSNIAPWETIW